METILFEFRKCQRVQENLPQGANRLHFNITSIYRNVKNPMLFLVSFQKVSSALQKVDCSAFNSVQVKKFVFELMKNNYPDVMINLDIVNGNYAIRYEMYKRVQNKFTLKIWK